MGSLHEFVTLAFFFSVGDETHARLGVADHQARVDSPHPRKLDQKFGSAVSVRSDIQQYAFSAFYGECRAQTRADEPWNQTKNLGAVVHRHSGVPCRDESFGAAFFDQLHADRHRILLFGAGFLNMVGHVQPLRRVNHTHSRKVAVMAFQFRGQLFFIPDQDDVDVKFLTGDYRGFQFGERAVITAHRV